ncbi:MAG: hypothetical protein MUE41_05525 [Gemmatimonadaceae bacterium]|nr:hypothetical protein [Gemmatimonadaceae bacterium]
MQRLFGEIRNTWPTLVVELAVLILGVSISFAVDQWRRDEDDRRYERRALRLIREGLVEDTTLASRVIVLSSRFKNAHEQLLVGGPPDSIDVWMDLAQSYADFKRVDWAYRELLATGNSRIIRHNEILGRLIRAYNTEYDALDEWDEINRQMVLNRIIPYVDDHSPYAPTSVTGTIISGLGAAYDALQTDDRFRNMQRSAAAYRGAQIAMAEDVKQRVRTLLPAVDSALATR